MTAGTDNTGRVLPDAGARTEALDPARSFIVQAPAGSGKTELLMQRFLSVLATATDPGELLAITFTRKAAGEMLERITSSLARASSPLEGNESENYLKTRALAERVLARDRELSWGLLDNPSKLRVMTIDSFSAALARSLPLMSGSGAGLSVTDNAEELYVEAAMRTIALAETDGAAGEAVRTVLAHLDNSVRALTDRLVVMLGKRDQWLRHVGEGTVSDDARRLLEGSLAVFIGEELDRAAQRIPEELMDTLVGFGRFAGENLLSDKPESPITALAGADSIPGTGPETLPLWKGLSVLLLTQKGELRSPKGVNRSIGFPNDKAGPAEKMKKAFKELLEGLSTDTALSAALAAVLSLPEPRYSDDDWRVLSSLVALLPHSDAMLREVFAERRQVDFQEVASAALTALGTDDDPTDLMLALDLRLRHILIDEYQDTSRTQLELLRLLTAGWERGDGRTLFIVGDPMQSIYLFREADVGLFLDARASGIGGVELEPVTLSSNFRSGGAIVDWVNDSFAGAFPESENRRTGAVTYALSNAVRTEVERLDPAVSVWFDRDDRREAREIATIVEAAPAGESVAVLVRSRTHLLEVIGEFKARGIAYESREIDPLAERPVVQDLMAILYALTHPLDRISWLALLRAPWCGLSLADVHRLCAGDRTAPVRSLLADWTRACSLSEEGQRRLSRFTGAIDSALLVVGRCSPRSLVEGLWTALGGPACVADEAGLRDAEVFLEMLGEVSGPASPPPRDLLEERTNKLFASPAPASGRAVQLMTIHKAKGLEFDHVILPGFGRPTRRSDRELLLWIERGGELLLAPIGRTGQRVSSPVYDYIRGIYREREELERTRLLYVAATRARRRLYLFAHVHEDRDGGHRITRDSLLASLSHRVGTHITVESSTGAQVGTAGAGEEGNRLAGGLARLAAGWSPPAPAPPALPRTRALPPSASEAGPVFEWAGATARHLGTVVHRYLSIITSEGLERWEVERAAGEAGNMASMLRGLGLGRTEAAAAAAEAVRMVSTVITDERGRWAVYGGESVATAVPEIRGAEVALTFATDAGADRVVIDRTFVDPEGTRWVVDYKTGSHRGGSLDGFLANERERYAAQMERYAAALRAAGEERPIRKGLYFPALGEWVEWD